MDVGTLLVVICIALLTVAVSVLSEEGRAFVEQQPIDPIDQRPYSPVRCFFILPRSFQSVRTTRSDYEPSVPFHSGFIAFIRPFVEVLSRVKESYLSMLAGDHLIDSDSSGLTLHSNIRL